MSKARSATGKPYGGGRGSPLGVAVDSAKARRPRVAGIELPAKRMTTTPGRINLKLVAEVLAEKGLDPTVELVDILQSGELPLDVQTRVLNELLQYTQPKLKSVEVKAKVATGAFDVTDDQARRIAEAFLKG